MAFGRGNAVSIAFEGKDNVSPVVRGIKNSMDGFKRDAAQGFGLAAGFNIMSTAMNVAGQAAGAAINYIGDSISLASDFAEQVGKTDVVFGAAAEAVKDWAETTAYSFGISGRAALEAAGTFGAMFSAMGITGREAADLSMSIVELAADLGSFYNVAEDEVLAALRSGLVGEAEPLRRFGVLLSAAAVEAEVLRLGLASSKSEITEQMKVMARWSLIQSSTAVANGNFADTADGMANSLKSVNAMLEDVQVQIGEEFLPYVQEALIWIRDDGIDILKDFADGFAEIIDVIDTVINAFGSEEQQALKEIVTNVRALRDELGWTQAQFDSVDAAARINVAEWMKRNGFDPDDPANGVMFEGMVLAWIANSSNVVDPQQAQLELSRGVTPVLVSAIKGWSEQVTEDIRVAVFETTGDFDINEVMMSAIGQATQTGLDWSDGLFGGVSGRISGKNGKTKRGKGSLYRTIKDQLQLERNNVRDLLRDPKLLEDIQTLYTEQKEFLERKLGVAQAGGNSLAALFIGNSIDQADVNLDGISGAAVAAATQYATSWNEGFDASIAEYLQRMMTGELTELSITATIAVQVTGDKGLAEWLMTQGVNPGALPPYPGGADGNKSTPYPRAMGGDTRPGGTYLVGENGPEILRLGSRGGSITPNHALGGSLDGVAVYLDGQKVGRLIDERLGKMFAGQRTGSFYRSN